MVVLKFLVAAVAALNVVGIQAGPCKVSSTSELSSSTPQVTSSTSESYIATSTITPSSMPEISSTPTRTTPSATPTTSLSPSLKTPLPDNTICGGHGHSLSNVGFIKDIFQSMTLAECAQTCENYPSCIFFAWNPNTWCELLSGFPDRDTVQTDWTWYELGCFNNLHVETPQNEQRAVEFSRAEEGGVLPASFYLQEDQ